MQFCFLINPVANAGKCLEKFAAVEELLQKRGVSYRVECSKRPGDITLLAKEAAIRKEDCVVVVGGDGTVREAVEALTYSETALCILPFGTGNDFAKTLGITESPSEGVERLLRGESAYIDAAKANTSYFLNVAGFGFDVEVLLQTERYKKRFKAKSAYIMGLLHALVHLKPYRITVEGTEQGRQYAAMIASVGNGRYIGGGMAAHPGADVKDGLLDVCIMHNVKKRRVPPVLTRFVKGRHIGLPETAYYRAKTVTITAETELPVQLDGEIIEKTPVTFQVLPNAIRLIL